VSLIAQVKARLPDVEKSLCIALDSGRGNCTAP
jgi:hypothetical protein